MIRAEVVEQVTLALSEPEQTMSERFRAVGQLEPTTEELRAAGDRLAAASVQVLAELGVLTAGPTVLSLSYRELCSLGARTFAQGYALGWLADQVAPLWASRPDVPLSDVCKILPRDRLAFIASELGKVGITALDEWLGETDDRSD